MTKLTENDQIFNHGQKVSKFAKKLENPTQNDLKTQKSAYRNS